MSKNKFRNTQPAKPQMSIIENQGQDPQIETSAAPGTEAQGVENLESKVEQTTEPVQTETAVQEEPKPSVVNSDAVQATVPDVQATAVAKDTATVVQTTRNDTPSDFQALISKIKAEGSKEEKTLIENIELYIDAMAPGKPIDVNIGARNQQQFWGTIKALVESAPQEQFKRLWAILLAHFDEHKNGVFSDRYVFRFAEFWNQNPDELTSYQKSLNLIKLTASVEDREKGLKQVDLGRTLEGSFNEQGKQRLIGFYQQ